MGYKQKGQDIKSSFIGFKNKTSKGDGGDGDSWSSLFSEIGTTFKNWWNSGEPSQRVNPEIKKSTNDSQSSGQSGNSVSKEHLSDAINRKGLYKRN
jgi:hypothetical protein